MLHALARGEAGLRLAAAQVKGLAMHAAWLHLRAALATLAAGCDIEARELQRVPDSASLTEQPSARKRQQLQTQGFIDAFSSGLRMSKWLWNLQSDMS